MPHKDIIVDSDQFFEINPDNRTIVNKSGKASVVQFDHNSERLTFTIPRFVDGHDMTESNRVEIHYVNASDSNSSEKNTGVYLVEDLSVDTSDDEKATFTWLISNNATQKNGSLTFIVRFICYGDEGEVVYSWSTNIFSNINVAKGMNNLPEVYEENVDLLQQWYNEIMDTIGEIEISGGAVQSDWNEETPSSLAYILNKPNIPTKISELEDDTFEIPIEESKYAENSNKADTANFATEAVKAISDKYGNDIGDTYLKKSEISSIKISELVDDTSSENSVSFASHSGLADMAYTDMLGNDITETYATKAGISQIGELIEEIIITDENNVKEIKRNTEPDGTLYDFKAMTVYYEIKPCTVQNLVIFKVYDGTDYSDSNMLIDYQGNCTATTSGRFVQAYFDVFAGLWIGIGNTTTIQGSPTGLQGWRMNHSALYTGQRIKSLNISSYTTDVFEVGSVIRIYGVR